MNLLLRLLILQIIIFSSALVVAEDSVTPPFKHCNKFPAVDKPMGYAIRDIAKELGRRLNASIEHVNAPIKRCVAMLKSGEADFILYDHVTDDRFKFMDFIHSSNTDRVVFLIRKEDGDWLKNYSDLESKTLGILSWYKYFPKLDNDNDIKKLSVTNMTQLPKILLSGRVDSFVTFDERANIMLLDYPDIVKASYNVDYFETSFIVISKVSPLHHRLDELKSIVLGMIDDGYVDRKLEEYIPGMVSPFIKSSNLN